MDRSVTYTVRGSLGNERVDGTLWLYIACLLSGILYSVTHLAVLGIVTTLAICTFLLVSSQEESYIFLFGMQFMRAVIPVQLGSSAFGFILFAYAILLLKMFYYREKLYGEYLAVGILFMADLVGCAYTNVLHIGDTVNWVLSLIYMILVLKGSLKSIDFERLVMFFLLAEWAVCLVNVFAELSLFGQTLVPEMYGVWVDGFDLYAFGKSYLAIAGGNEIAFSNALGIALCIMMWRYAKKTRTKVFYFFSILFFAYTGIMLIARAFYVELLLFLVLYILCSIKDLHRFAVTLWILGLCGIVFYFVADDAVLVTLERVLLRFEAGNVTRENLLAQSFQLLSSDVGIFLHGGGTYYPEKFGFTAHNHYVDAFLSLGLLSEVLYLAVIIKTMYGALRRNRVRSLKACLPLIMLVTYKFISGSVRDVGFYFYLSMVVVFAVYMTGREEHGRA